MANWYDRYNTEQEQPSSSTKASSSSGGNWYDRYLKEDFSGVEGSYEAIPEPSPPEPTWFDRASSAVGSGLNALGEAIVESPINRLMAAGAVDTLGGGARAIDRLTRRDDSLWLENPLVQQFAISQGATPEQIEEAVARNRAGLANPTALGDFASTSAGVARELRESVPTLIDQPEADNRWSLQNLGHMAEQGLRGAVETLPGMLGGGLGTLTSAGGRSLQGAYEDVFNSEMEKGIKEGKSPEQAEKDARAEAQQHFIARGIPAAALEFLPLSRMMGRAGTTSVGGNIAHTAGEEAGAEGLGYAWNELYDVAARGEEAKPLGEYVTGLAENMVAGAVGGAGTAGTVGAGANIGRRQPPSNTGVPAFDAGVNSVIETGTPEINATFVEDLADSGQTESRVAPVANAPTGDLFTPNNEGVFVGDMFSNEPVVASDIADRQRLRDVAEARNEDGTLANPEMNRLPEEATEAEIEYIFSQQERLNQLIKERDERIAFSESTAPTDAEITNLVEEIAETGSGNPVIAQAFQNIGIRDWLEANNPPLPETFTPSRVPTVETPEVEQTSMELPPRAPDARDQQDLFHQAPRVPVEAPVSPSTPVSTPTATTTPSKPKAPQKPVAFVTPSGKNALQTATQPPKTPTKEAPTEVRKEAPLETRRAISNQLLDEGLVEGTRQYNTRQSQLLREAGFDVPADNRRAVQTSPLNVGEKVRVKVDGNWTDATIVSESPNKAVYGVQVEGRDKPISLRDQEIERGERTVARERAVVPKTTKDSLSKGLAALEDRIKKAGGSLPPKITRKGAKGEDVVDTDKVREAVQNIPEAKRREALVDMVRTADPAPEDVDLPRNALASSPADQNTRVKQNMLSRVKTADKLLDRVVTELKKAGIAPKGIDRLVAALKIHNLGNVGVEIITPQNAKNFGSKVFRYTSENSTAAFYDPATDTIYLKSADFKANGIDPVTQFHEILHAGTFNAIWNVENGKTKDKGAIEAVNDLKKLYNEFKKSTDDFKEFPSDVRFELEYAAKDAHEFASVVGSDIRVQRALVERGLFRKFWDAVKRLLGLPPRVEKDFDAVIDAIENVIRSSVDLTRVSDHVEAQLSGVKLAKETLPDTIEVDGVQRPTTNSNGNLIHPTEDGIRNFWKWFGDSKVVNKEGKPLVVYHGTSYDFDTFAITKTGEFGPGIYLTDSPDEAGSYTRTHQGRDDSVGASVIPAYVAMQNPFVVRKDAGEFWSAFDHGKGDADTVRRAIAEGYDGVIFNRPRMTYDRVAGFTETGDMDTHYVAFRPEQIKSATGNRGTFDPTDASIVRSQKNVDAEESTPSPEEKKGWRSVAALRVLEDWLVPGGVLPFGKDSKTLRAVRDVVLSMQGRMTGSSLSGHETEAQLSKAMKSDKFTDSKAVRAAMASGDYSNLPPKTAKAAQQAALERDQLRYNLAREILQAKPFETMTGPEKAVINKIINNVDYFTDVYLQDVVKNYSKDMLDRGEAGKATPEDMAILEQVRRDLERFVAIPSDLAEAYSSRRIRADEVRRLYKTRIGAPTTGKTAKELVAELERLRDFQDKENYNLTIQKLMEELADPKNTAIGRYFRGSSTIFGDRLGKMEVPESFRKFWGYVNPDENIALATAATIQKQTAVLNRVSTINYLDEVGTRDGWATKHPTKGSKQLIGSKWGALANKYVPEVVRDYLEAQLDATQMALDTYNNMISSDPNLYTGAMGTKVVKGISGLSGINKMNTVVGSVALWAMAFGGGVTSLIANGNFTLKGFKRGTKGIFGGVGTAFRTEFNEVTKELINNKMFDSPTIRDVNAALKKDFVRTALQKEGTVNSKVKALWGWINTGALTFSEGYAAMDLVYTGSNYFYNKGGLKAHWDKIGKDYTEQELQTEAAAMTRTTNISFAKVPKLVTALERLGGPMMFMGYMMETLRVIPANVAVGGKQVVEGVKSGDVAWTRQGIQRLVGAGVAVTMWQFLAGMLRGSDEDEKEKRKVDALVANHNFVDAPTVVRMFTRDDGTEVYLPLGRFDPFEPSNNIISALVEGRNVSDSVKDLFIQNTLWARAWNAATADSPEQIRSKVTSYDRQAWDEWVDGSYTKAGLSVFMDTALPSTARNISGALTKAERDENYTALQQTSDSLGMRLIEYHPVKSLQDFGRTFDIETDKAWTTLSRKLGANRDISDEEVRSVYAEYLAEERRRVADLTKAVEVAKENGGSVYQIQQYLERGGLSKTAALNMARNPASFTRGLSDRFLAEREKALLENPQNSSPERQRQIKERFRQRRRDMERAIREMRINRNGS